MTDDDHRSLADVLHSIKGMIIISSYHSDLYDQELYPDWRQVEIKTHADGARPRTEVLYFSPNCPEIA
jgi:DNA adenine methylase